MSKNQPSFGACGRFGFWNFFVRSNSKRSYLLDSLSMVGVTGFEPVTLRLSSACSNQLSYTPDLRFALTFSVDWWRQGDSNP